MQDSVLYSRLGHVGRLVLNNPRRHNALGEAQLGQLSSRLSAIGADDRVRVLIITGGNGTTFCAGAALNELDADALESNVFQQVTGQLASLSIPTICAINGDVFGGGVELAVSCDFRIGIEGIRMQVPAAAIGLCYPLDGLQRFVQCLGPAVSRRLLLAAEEFDTEGMVEIGFLDRVVPATEIERECNDLARHMASLAPLAVQSMKHILRQAGAGQVDEGEAAALASLCITSEDIQEGFAAKREKRRPRFRGR